MPGSLTKLATVVKKMMQSIYKARAHVSCCMQKRRITENKPSHTYWFGTEAIANIHKEVRDDLEVQASVSIGH